jgi:hypothetical protein
MVDPGELDANVAYRKMEVRGTIRDESCLQNLAPLFATRGKIPNKSLAAFYNAFNERNWET